MKKITDIYKYLKKIFKKNKIKKIMLIIVKSNDSPHQIALGAAIGAFLSVIPTFSLGMFTSLFIAWKKKLNLLSTYLGTLFVTPLTSSFVYLINYKVGSFILGNNSTINLPIEFHDIKYIVKQVYFGGIINATIISIILYLSIYITVSNYKRLKEK